jgi:putative selenium metabolism protein SsnA
MLIIGNGKLITRDDKNHFYENGAVVISEGLITEVGDCAQIRHKYAEADWLDCHGGVIMPGLINAHSHIYSAFARGLSLRGFSPKNFYEVLDGQWWKIDRLLTVEDTRFSAYQTYIDSIKNGVTTLFDHHASYGQVEGSLFAIADVAQELGFRTCLCYEVSDRNGEKARDAAIAENAAFIARCKKENSALLKAMFGLHASFTLSDDTLEKCVKANNADTGFHIHVAEGMDDVHDSRRRYHKTTVERLNGFGIIGEKTIYGHCVHVTEPEMELIQATDTMVVNNPQSNMGNAVGCSPVLSMARHNILLGLGTDAYTHDMLESLKTALAIQRHNAGMPNVGWAEAVGMLFEGNRRIGARYFDRPLGRLQEGALADIAVFDYKAYTPFHSANCDGHILFGMSGKQCIHTIINGNVVMKNRKLLCCDEDAVNEETLKLTNKFFHTVNL